MNECLITRRGGKGGTNLNFKVKAYASADLLPEMADENTIAVITENEITSWVFDTNAPESPTEGALWIKTGSGVKMEVVEDNENTLYVDLNAASQYTAGAWIKIDAYVYQEGWQALWAGVTIVKNGIAGEIGFSTNAGYTNYPINFSAGSGYLLCRAVAGYTGAMVANQKIDLSGASEIKATLDVVTVTNEHSTQIIRGVSVVVMSQLIGSSGVSWASAIVAAAQTKTTGNNQTLSIPWNGAEGEYYVGILLGAYGGTNGQIRLYNLEVV